MPDSPEPLAISWDRFWFDCKVLLRCEALLAGWDQRGVWGASTDGCFVALAIAEIADCRVLDTPQEGCLVVECRFSTEFAALAADLSASGLACLYGAVYADGADAKILPYARVVLPEQQLLYPWVRK